MLQIRVAPTSSQSARALAQSKSWRPLQPTLNTRSVLDCASDRAIGCTPNRAVAADVSRLKLHPQPRGEDRSGSELIRLTPDATGQGRANVLAKRQSAGAVQKLAPAPTDLEYAQCLGLR